MAMSRRSRLFLNTSLLGAAMLAAGVPPPPVLAQSSERCFADVATGKREVRGKERVGRRALRDLLG